MSDEAASLARVPLFALLADDSLRRLTSRSTRRSVDAGSIVVVQGQSADHLIVVANGTLTAMHDTAHGRRLRLGDFTGPCAIDKVAVLDAGGYTATWVAVTDSRLWLIPRDELLDIIGNVAAARQHVLSYLAQQVRQQQQSLVNARFGDTTTRIAAWLVSAAGDKGTRVLLPGAQEGLGEAVGVTRVSVNRALRSLARDGLIRTERAGGVHPRSLRHRPPTVARVTSQASRIGGTAARENPRGSIPEYPALPGAMFAIIPRQSSPDARLSISTL